MVSFEWLAGLAVGVIGWGTRLESRVNGLSLVMTERRDSDNERHEELMRRLDRIERKIDASNGGSKNRAN